MFPSATVHKGDEEGLSPDQGSDAGPIEFSLDEIALYEWPGQYLGMSRSSTSEGR